MKCSIITYITITIMVAASHLVFAEMDDGTGHGTLLPPPIEEADPDLHLKDRLILENPGDILSLATFDTNTEGWIKIFDCSTAVNWIPQGYVEAEDECFDNPPPPPPYGCIYWMWEAPGDFVLPAATEALGGILSYDLKMSTTNGSFGSNAFDVAIFGGNFEEGFEWITLYGISNQLHTDWRSYSVTLDSSSNWVEWGNPSVQIPPETVELVLSNLQRILIRGAYKSECKIGNGSSLDNVQITAGGTSPGELVLDLSTLEMTPSDDSGWYTENPVTITATMTCPAGGPDCPNPFALGINSSSGARFYYLDRDLGGEEIPVECEEIISGSDYSHTALIDGCVRVGAATALTLFAGETKTLAWRLWIQPSDMASLEVTAVWGNEPIVKTLMINPSSIHPVVFVHGILGSQPPGNTVVESWPQLQGDVIDFSLGPHLDPFIGSYKPLIDNLLRMGYEINRSLFPVTYDWRQSNINSAAWLRWVLNTRVGAYPDYEPRFRRWHKGGQPRALGRREWINGDGLIPHWSTRLFYSMGLLAGQLSWSERKDQELRIDDADHVMIMATQQTQSVIGAILSGTVAPSAAREEPALFPVYSPYQAPTQILNNLDVYISFLLGCPENPGEE